MIRLTGGAWRGRVVPSPSGGNVRPTAGRVREAVFSMLGQDLRGTSFLDVCGGSGAMAFEAASRGAAPVVVVERDRVTADGIRRAAAALSAPVQVRQGDALRLPLDAADVVYLDPPYREPVGPWLERGVTLARRTLVAEARAGAAWPPRVGAWALDRQRVYGEATVALYLPAESDGV